MSDPSTPPPIPPQFIPYAQVESPRPGILTAIAILSIVLGSLGVISNSCGIFQWATISMMRNTSTLSTPAIIIPATQPVATSPTSAGESTFDVESPSPAPAPTNQRGQSTGTTTTIIRTGGSVRTNPFASLSLLPAVITSILSIFQFALAVYLLFAGVQLTRNISSSRKHHLRYAMLKIPLALIAALAGVWASYELQRAIFSGTTSPGVPWGNSIPLLIGVVSATFGLLFAIAYPIFLLIVLTRPGIRAYFDSMHRA